MKQHSFFWSKRPIFLKLTIFAFGRNTEISSIDKSDKVVRSVEIKNYYYIFLYMIGIINVFTTILSQLQGLSRHNTESGYILKTSLTGKQVSR